MKNNVAKKMRKKGVGKKVTCPQVLVVCYMYIAIASEPTSLPTKQRNIL
jgi:hypothetical protein